MFDSAPINLPVEPPKPPSGGQAPAAQPSPVASAAINVTGTREPEDIFAGIKEAPAQANAAVASALPPKAPSRSGTKVALAIIIPIVVLGLGVGGWYAYKTFFAAKPQLNLPSATEQQKVTPVTSAPDEAPQPANPFPKPNEDQMAAAQATISMMQGQAAQAQAQADALAQQGATSTAMPPLPDLMATPTGDVAATSGQTQPEIPLPATNPAIPLPEQAYAQSLVDGTDSDADGLTNAEELVLGTDPSKKDTDGDGFEDGSETKSGYDPLVKSKKLEDSSALKRETVGEAIVLVPKTWERVPGLGGAVAFKTGTPAAFSLTLQTFATGASLMDWVVGQNPGTAAGDYQAAKNASGYDMVYSKDKMTVWLLQGNTVITFRYATNGAQAKDFGTLFEVLFNRARTAQ